MIASVSFRNFKALRSTQLKLLPFNLVIGPNGSGKTSLIQAVMRLRTLSRLPLTDPAAQTTKPHGPEIVFGFNAPYAALTARLACVSENVCDLLEVTPAGAKAWPALQGQLGRMRSYLLDHYAIPAPAERTDRAELAANGGNLAAVLSHWQLRRPDIFAQLEAELVRILPEFGGIEMIPRHDGVAELGLRLKDGSETVAAENLSQGTLYTLAMMALAFDPSPPTMVCIEEIDRGIHPRMLREVRDLLYRLSYPEAFGLKRPPVQVIVTTHSPYLLDLFREHPEEIVISHKRGNAAHFERLADRQDLDELLAEGTLGDMWFSGILGGVPEEP